jgi:hypothetical protein
MLDVDNWSPYRQILEGGLEADGVHEGQNWSIKMGPRGQLKLLFKGFRSSFNKPCSTVLVPLSGVEIGSVYNPAWWLWFSTNELKYLVESLYLFLIEDMSSLNLNDIVNSLQLLYQMDRSKWTDPDSACELPVFTALGNQRVGH